LLDFSKNFFRDGGWMSGAPAEMHSRSFGKLGHITNVAKRL